MTGADLDRYDAAALSRRRGAKWAVAKKGEIAAWIADMDFPVAPAVRTALESAIADDDLGYPSAALVAQVAQGFAQRAADRYGLVVDPVQVLVTTDVLQGIELALLTLTAPGDGVLFFTPSYPPYFSAVEDVGRRVVTCELVEAGGRLEIDGDRLTDVVRAERPRCILLCNPHNPTGRVFTRRELAAVGELAADHDLVVLADEVHADLTYPGSTHVAFGTLGTEVAERTVTLSSASKAFNLAGLRCAVAACGSDSLFTRLDAYPEHARGGLSMPGLLATHAAWRDGGAWLAAVLAELEVGRDLVVARLGRLPGVRVRAPEATYLAWLDLRETDLGTDPAHALRSRAGVILSPGELFGASGAGHVRLNFATPRPVLEELIGRIEGAIGA